MAYAVELAMKLTLKVSDVLMLTSLLLRSWGLLRFQMGFQNVPKINTLNLDN